jgi:hypothetical protein
MKTNVLLKFKPDIQEVAQQPFVWSPFTSFSEKFVKTILFKGPKFLANGA